VSAPELVTPNAYSFAELKVAMECRKRSLFRIITIAAKVTDRPLRFCKSRVILAGRGRQDR